MNACLQSDSCSMALTFSLAYAVCVVLGIVFLVESWLRNRKNKKEDPK